MPTARPFARNTGAPIAGTIQVGNLAVGVPTAGFAATGLPWWNGPDEELGYVIATQVAANNQPTPVPPSVTASVGFWRSTALTNASFISLAEYVSRIAGTPQTFVDGSAAKTWLNTNGYWTSWAIQVGDYYGGGMVGYIFQPGDLGYVPGETHGIIGATTNLNAVWFSSGGYFINQSFDIGMGATNTSTVISTLGSASYACYDARNYNGGGYNDWFLPSCYELRDVHTAIESLLPNIQPNLYWSSSGNWLRSVKGSNGINSCGGYFNTSLGVWPCRYF
jgi:hypothetical protein